jgi:hypothetical protein
LAFTQAGGGGWHPKLDGLDPPCRSQPVVDLVPTRLFVRRREHRGESEQMCMQRLEGYGLH